MYVRAGLSSFARPYVGVHWSTSLICSSLFLQQCAACLVRLTWIVFVMGGRWPYSWCLVGCYSCLYEGFDAKKFLNAVYSFPSKVSRCLKNWLSVGERLVKYGGWRKIPYPLSVRFCMVTLATWNRALFWSKIRSHRLTSAGFTEHTFLLILFSRLLSSLRNFWNHRRIVWSEVTPSSHPLLISATACEKLWSSLKSCKNKKKTLQKAHHFYVHD